MRTEARPYVMRERAAQVERTRATIVDATVALGYTNPISAVTLPAIAARAGVSVQTVLRQFGTRDAVLAAAAERGRAAVLAERSIDPDDLTATLGALVDHYELRGDGVLLLLAQESWEPIAADVTSAGKQLHRTWVEAAFTRQLPPAPGAARVAVIDQLAVATDVYAWKLLRRDRGLDRDTTVDRIRAMALAILAAAPQPSCST